jgi:hypothetical protein
MWKSLAGQNIQNNKNNNDDDEWETDADFVVIFYSS